MNWKNLRILLDGGNIVMEDIASDYYNVDPLPPFIQSEVHQTEILKVMRGKLWINHKSSQRKHFLCNVYKLRECESYYGLFKQKLTWRLFGDLTITAHILTFTAIFVGFLISEGIACRKRWSFSFFTSEFWWIICFLVLIKEFLSNSMAFDFILKPGPPS